MLYDIFLQMDNLFKGVNYYMFKVIVYEIIDGDTFKAKGEYSGGRESDKTYRLFGIDCEEVKHDFNYDCIEECWITTKANEIRKNKSTKSDPATNRVIELLRNNDYCLYLTYAHEPNKKYSDDIYGRCLVRAYLDYKCTKSLGETLVNEKLAKKVNY